MVASANYTRLCGKVYAEVIEMKKNAKIAIAGLAALLLVGGVAYAHWGFGPYGGYAAPGWGYGMGMMGPGMMGYGGYPAWGYGYGFGKELTDEQRAEIQEKIQELQEKGAYPWEIRTEVFKLLQKFGVIDNETTPVPGYGFAPGFYGCPMWGYGW
jgi:hypothetical protein